MDYLLESNSGRLDPASSWPQECGQPERDQGVASSATNNERESVINANSSTLPEPTVSSSPFPSQASLSRSSGRSSSRLSRSPRRHRHHHRRRRSYFKEKERNFFAAVCSMIVIVILCTALANPRWFYMRGGGCRTNDKNKSPVHSLGVNQFFYMGHFQKATVPEPLILYHYGPEPDAILVNCVTQRMLQVMRFIIALCFVGVMFSFIAFLLDLSGPNDRILKILRRNAVFNILTVIGCVTVNGLSFLVTQLLDSLQSQTRLHHNSKVDVRFDVSFYLVAAAGATSVLATAFNLLRRYPPTDPGPSEQRIGLLDEYDGMDIVHCTSSNQTPAPDEHGHVNVVIPPPAYSP